jgi:hypothetical protein
MTADSIIASWQFAAVIVGLLIALGISAFVVLCIVGVALWAARAGRDDAPPSETEPDWFESLS